MDIVFHVFFLLHFGTNPNTVNSWAQLEQPRESPGQQLEILFERQDLSQVPPSGSRQHQGSRGKVGWYFLLCKPFRLLELFLSIALLTILEQSLE